jgi:NADPH-dependent 2,4-dienoyl-CoA reductase/sulfur reductase-like enzyme
MRRIATDIAIIGGGPAGLSAALAAAKVGAKVDVIDAGFVPGGQYWMQDPTEAPATTKQAVEGRAAIEAAQAAGITFHSGAEVWAVFPDLRIGANGPDGPFEIVPRAIIVASGAQDRVMPFPGWTLPGVMTPGAGQRLMKLGGIPAGERVVLAGSGPFLLAVAQTLIKSGKPPVALIEARKPNAGMAAHLALYPARWAEAFRLITDARAIPDRRTGWIVTEALGTERVTAVKIAPIGTDGRVAHEKSETIAGIDALLVGWGFRPNIEVTALLRCRHDCDRALGGWFCVSDPATGKTSVEHVYAAGEVTGIAGSVPARLSGRLAGIAAAADLGFAGATLATERAEVLAKLVPARRFAAGLGRLYAPPETLSDLAKPDTIVCRCEEITRADITAAFDAGTRAVAGAKMWTRAGMGRCQGRICGWAIAEIAAAVTGAPPKDSGFNAPRLPLRPVPLSVVLEATREAEA